MPIKSLIISLIIESLKKGFSKLKNDHPIKKTISKISTKYENVENLSQTFEKWLSNKNVQNKIKEFVEGNREINIEDLSRILIEDGEFYLAKETKEKSIEIIQDFFSILNDEYLVLRLGNILT